MKIIVVGSGVAGAHAALTLLERGYGVEMWDVGREESPFPEKGTTFHGLKDCVSDPVEYFLGKELSALVPPAAGELIRYPPSRQFLTSRDDPLWGFNSDDFVPYGSYNKGGLANGWGANALPFDDDDMEDWPVSFSELESAYKTAYERIPVAGPDEDDLSPYLATSGCSQPAVRLSDADHRLMSSYEKNKEKLHKLGVRVGLARLAVITDPDREDACDYCDRCLWGCPRRAIYNPKLSTLRSCESYRKFSYVPDRFVLSLVSREGKITAIRYLNTVAQKVEQEPCDAVFLAAGALQTGAIFLRTLRAARPDVSPETDGLMDTSVVKLPFVALKRIGLSSEARSFQFNRLLIGIIGKTGRWPRYLHGELLNLTSLIYHPLIESMPFDSRSSKRFFFALRSALGVVTLFFPDKINRGNCQVMEGDDSRNRIQLRYREIEAKRAYMRSSIAKIRSALWRLGCVPWGVAYSPSGGGIHYAGTVPMGMGAKRCDANGRSNTFSNLYIADGAAFPSLPSKSITLSLAAHATRTARKAIL